VLDLEADKILTGFDARKVTSRASITRFYLHNLRQNILINQLGDKLPAGFKMGGDSDDDLFLGLT
jgi:hypothetical protein